MPLRNDVVSLAVATTSTPPSTEVGSDTSAPPGSGTVQSSSPVDASNPMAAAGWPSHRPARPATTPSATTMPENVCAPASIGTANR